MGNMLLIVGVVMPGAFQSLFQVVYVYALAISQTECYNCDVPAEVYAPWKSIQSLC